MGWNVLIYAISVLAVWFSGVSLAGLVDKISDRTGMGKAFAGFVLLSLATSFPELVTSIATAQTGKADMVGSNLAGGVCMQTAILCAADWRYGRNALTGHAPTASNLMSGTIVLLLLSIAFLGFVMGDFSVFGHVGIFPIVIFAAMLAGMRIMYLYQNTTSWLPENQPQFNTEDSGDSGTSSAVKIYGQFVFYTLCIGIAGTLVTYASEAVSIKWNIGSGFTGAVFVAISTSLPELSASLQAVKMNRTTIAIGNIFGSNVFDMSLLFVGDIFYTKGALFNHFTKVSALYIGLAAILTVIYIIGMLERRDKARLRLGTDSLLVLVLYIAGLAVSYYIS